MRSETRKLDSGGRGPVSAVVTHSDGTALTTLVVLAHGAGTDMNNALLVAFQEGLAGAGYASMRFNFPYKEIGRRAPDPKPVLENCYRSVIEQVRADIAPARLVIGGKSMGGRIASHLAARGVPVDGLLFLGYPLHPAGRPQQLRTAHLTDIRSPMLFFAGTRDSLCRLDLLDAAVAPLKTLVRLHIIEGGDHSFRVPKRSGRTEHEVYEEIVSTSVDWLRSLER